MELSDPENATLADATGTGTVVDDDDPPVACGAPTYDKATERALFVWQDCTSGNWSVRVTAGGPNSTFSGEVRATTTFNSVTPFSIEGNDLFDFTSTPGVIAYGLIVGGAGQDGFSFALPAGQSACLTLTAPAVPVYAGSTRLLVTSPVDLATMGACGDPPDPPEEVPVTQWINPTGGVSTAGNSVSYSGAGGGWNAHTVNSAPLSMLGATDEYKVEFTIGSNPANTTWVLGFGITESEAGWRDVDFGLRSTAGALSVYEGGNWVVNLGTLAIGDRLGIAINGTATRIPAQWRNGAFAHDNAAGFLHRLEFQGRRHPARELRPERRLSGGAAQHRLSGQSTLAGTALRYAAIASRSGCRQRREILLHGDHRAADRVVVGREAACEIVRKVGSGPVADLTAAGRDIRNTALALEPWRAGQPPIATQAAHRVTRRVAFATVPRAFDQRSSAQRRLIGGLDGRDRLRVEVAKFPEADAAPQ